jgi:hypothetical protein
MGKVRPYLFLLDVFACGIGCPQVNSGLSLLADQRLSEIRSQLSLSNGMRSSIPDHGWR